MTDNASDLADLEVRAFNRVWNDDIALFVRGFDWSDGKRKRMIGREVVLAEIIEGAYEPNPTLAISRTAAQHLIDELWNCGLRPTQGRQSEGVTAAQARHLDDIRAIAFAKLNIVQPGAQ